ncbi:hypothetical protein EUGRSUZ_B02937 [Eucalyptus grandis]|uniref:Uncharacterized protein n=2 Tax=Eucalyptus grandis TaxID=71139 RepID=A0ACC3LV90_EUCGR|nr:hypothetical protein EUGRSUZ_B02937 [Eucalyptus grandis]
MPKGRASANHQPHERGSVRREKAIATINGRLKTNRQSKQGPYRSAGQVIGILCVSLPDRATEKQINEVLNIMIVITEQESIFHFRVNKRFNIMTVRTLLESPTLMLAKNISNSDLTSTIYVYD